MKPAVFRAALSLALVATLAASYFAPAASDGIEPGNTLRRASTSVPSANPSKPMSKASSDPHPIDILAIRPRGDDDAQEPSSALFSYPEAITSAPVQQDRTPEPTQASPPQPPSLPFRVLGRYVEDGTAVIFLQHGDQNLLARVGDVIGENYSVEEIGSEAMVLNYIPLGVRQSLVLIEPQSGGRP